MKNIVLLIMDGLGDNPNPEFFGKTALQAAYRPNLNALCRKSICGLMDPVGPGIRSGSDTSHLSILGYSPERYYNGRGPFEALGLGMELYPGDVAFRANYAYVSDGYVLDRRAGRIRDTCELSRAVSMEIEDVKITVKSGTEHRAAIVMHGPGLSSMVSDSDPHRENERPMEVRPLDKKAEKTARILNEFIKKSREILNKHPVNIKRMNQGLMPANEILIRGAGMVPDLEDFYDRYHLKAACISGTPLIKGICRLAGMDIINMDNLTGRVDENYSGIFEKAHELAKKYDFIIINIKGTDIAGHDRRPDIKRSVIENVDSAISKIINDLDDLLIIVTGDHSTPCNLGDHSGDPVPIMFSSNNIRSDNVMLFDETSVRNGSLRIRGLDVMKIALSLSNRSEKYGA
ncbi:2,3-bisphosphoglycerate-independent phosphoglycerate mutase [Picrophilus oshimae]|uniref:2,3-bisphosphoglycerate-independent phosphoglycerate mutase n=1 Tax=Picrophilus torridus (strain ATCC 700027 / DSM 9790 / JCM 10055 / NBRC 100828 / KAW 2/3) TaxID=1122961 RepID=APGM_PICTO|nr:2,3-bisphosphoglycerate-independent phosphoglycerate mutase [Picrophilus oshimae]Q6KZJ6.1 RecName: Full=2,3-bisphosphoglycerate-independent phosphoglycerate mutase; Short=BPG-independent PGAM; Short=Phosphoglyceromutase; Short=aPGAM [Picrophilus oshimae DSM 9789]AAT43856.1 phosphoglycerate mutase [Picrophilus oshimae DSM 9789]